MRIVGIVGNLKKISFNRWLLEACAELAPPGMTLVESPIEGIPLFNEDERLNGDPDVLAQLKSDLADADGVMVFTPEYNAGIPGVLKNAIDWLSGTPSVLKGKPTGVMGASTGYLGTARAQAQLRISLEHCGAPVMPQPQVFVRRAREQFDSDGRLSDAVTRAFIADYLKHFAVWVERNHIR